jgi:hypothetical protein
MVGNGEYIEKAVVDRHSSPERTTKFYTQPMIWVDSLEECVPVYLHFPHNIKTLFLSTGTTSPLLEA